MEKYIKTHSSVPLYTLITMSSISPTTPASAKPFWLLTSYFIFSIALNVFFYATTLYDAPLFSSKVDVILANSVVIHFNALSAIVLYCIVTSQYLHQQMLNITQWFNVWDVNTLHTEESTDSLMELHMTRSTPAQPIQDDTATSCWSTMVLQRINGITPSMRQTYILEKTIINTILLTLICVETTIALIYIQMQRFMVYVSISVAGLFVSTLAGAYWIQHI